MAKNREREGFQRISKSHLGENESVQSIEHESETLATNKEFKNEENVTDPENSSKVALVKQENFSVSPVDNNVSELIKSMIQKTGSNFICQQCGKTGSDMSNMKKHIETHIDGVVHSCHICGKTTRSKNALNTHKSRNHKTE